MKNYSLYQHKKLYKAIGCTAVDLERDIIPRGYALMSDEGGDYFWIDRRFRSGMNHFARFGAIAAAREDNARRRRVIA